MLKFQLMWQRLIKYHFIVFILYSVEVTTEFAKTSTFVCVWVFMNLLCELYKCDLCYLACSSGQSDVCQSSMIKALI